MENKNKFYWIGTVEIRSFKDEWNGRDSDELYELETRSTSRYEAHVFEIFPAEDKLREECGEEETSRIEFTNEKKEIGIVDIDSSEFRRLSRNIIIVCDNNGKFKGLTLKYGLKYRSFIWDSGKVITISDLVVNKKDEDVILCSEIMDAVFELE